MKKKLWAFLILTALLLTTKAHATPPSANERNIDFNVDVVKKPEKIGDILEVTWSYTINEETDSIYRAFCMQIDSQSLAKAYFTIHPPQEFISGDSVSWADIEYGTTHSFSFAYRIITGDRITGAPTLEICENINGNWVRATRNKGR